MANVNTQMKKLHAAAMDCIKHLVLVKKISVDKAEEMVLETLKESEAYIKAGMVNETIQTLKMIHMDKSPESAAQDTIKSILK